MSTCVEIVGFLGQKSPQTTIEPFLEQAGDHLLASCMYEDLERILIVVQLSPTADKREHSVFLQLALQQGIIESYEFMICYPVSVFLDPSLDRDEYMRAFPLRCGESWYPALDYLHSVYICLTQPFLTPAQTDWLSHHQARWEFVDGTVNLLES